jgi:hypothetical protein
MFSIAGVFRCEALRISSPETTHVASADRWQELPHFRRVCAPSNQAKSMYLNRDSEVCSQLPAAIMRRYLLPFMSKGRSRNDS